LRCCAASSTALGSSSSAITLPGGRRGSAARAKKLGAPGMRCVAFRAAAISRFSMRSPCSACSLNSSLSDTRFGRTSPALGIASRIAPV